MSEEKTDALVGMRDQLAAYLRWADEHEETLLAARLAEAHASISDLIR